MIQVMYVLYQNINTQTLMQNQTLKLFQSFIEKEEIRNAIPITNASLKSKLIFEEITIRKEFDCGNKKQDKKKYNKKEVPEDFMNAFKELVREEMVVYYVKTIQYIQEITKGRIKPNFENESYEAEGYTKSFHLKVWKHKTLRFDSKRNLIYGERDGEVKIYDLANYLIRKSRNNNKEYHVVVLEAINNKPIQQLKKVHIGFKNPKTYEIFFKHIMIGCDFCLYQSLSSQIIGNSKEENLIKKEQPNHEIQKSKSYINLPSNLQTHIEDSSSIPIQKSINAQEYSISPRLNHNEDQNIMNDEEVKNEKQENRQNGVTFNEDSNEMNQWENNFNDDEKWGDDNSNYENEIHKVKKILPGYDFEALQSYENYDRIDMDLNKNEVSLFKNKDKNNSLKLRIALPKGSSFSRIIALLTIPELNKKLNTEIEELEVKTMIKTENTALMYQKNRPFNKLYRSRDFLFLKHLYLHNDVVFIIDKSIEDPQYPPFITIVRGSLQIIWGIYNLPDEVRIIADIEINNQGYLNQLQNQTLTIKYLKGFINFDKMLDSDTNDYHIFALPNLNLEKKTIPQKNNTKHDQQPVEVKINDPNHNQPIKVSSSFSKDANEQIYEQIKEINEIKESQMHEMQVNKEKTQQIQKRINKNGQVIIDDGFRKAEYRLKPHMNGPMQYLELFQGKEHPIWKGEWKLDPEGGILFINEKKINDQKGVLKFILSQIGKNLLSGKSILNISLPIDIFAAMSNLELLSLSMTYAPCLLQKSVGLRPLEQMKAVIAFGISMSSTYLIMEKPFNPVLGETLQTFIHGCPLYAQQISHHPPISALYLVGRGYTLSAQLQSKASLSMNSGYGINDGVFSVQFTEGSKVCFMGPYGQVSGLIYGNRKFNIIGKAYGWMEEESLFVEIVFNPKKGFFGKNTQADYFEGVIYETKPAFLKKFISSTKKYGPSKSEIVRDYGKFHGVWHKQIKFEDEVILDIDREYPIKMTYDEHPLPSDSNWREDITYRKLMQITKAQKYKEAIEIKQRADKKLREEFAKKKKK